MRLERVDIPAAIRDHLTEAGIDELYPPQAAAVERGVTDGASLVAALPTASGKTLIAQLAMVSTPGTAVYVVPLRALAAEKHRAFDRLPDTAVGIATGDYAAGTDDLADADIVVATSEKLDSLVRHGASWLADVSCLVVDEAHLLGDPDRGPTLEMTIARLRRLATEPQIVALSATVANPEAIADWLDAALLESEWRPIELRTGVYHDGRVTFADGTEEAVWATRSEPTAALTEETLGDGGQVLVFVHSRRAAEELAGELTALDTAVPEAVTDAVTSTAETATGRALADRLRGGTAFHHAGLRPAHRRRVEDAFRQRELRVLCATPTLAAGINVPARRVIVRDHHRYTDEGRATLSVLEVHQMFGRAGRPGLDPHGEALLIAENATEADALIERYLEGSPKAVTSKLATQEALRIHTLATVASGFAGTRGELLEVLGETFYAAREEPSTLVDIADLVLDELDAAAMLAREDGLRATSRGELVSQLYVDPRTATALLDALEAAATRPPDRVGPITALELVCDTPDMTVVYPRGEESSTLYRYAASNAERLLTDVHADFEDAEEARFREWLAALKTARVLAAWVDGESVDAITAEYAIGPGDLRATADRAEWLVGAAASLAEHEGIEGPLVGTLRTVAAALDERSLRAEPP